MSVCPDCGGGWTFDFQQKRVYCRTCESRKAVAAVDPVEAEGRSSHAPTTTRD